jgi:hypothetical protein
MPPIAQRVICIPTLENRSRDDRLVFTFCLQDPRFKAVWEAVKNDGVSVHEAILGLVVAQFDVSCWVLYLSYSQKDRI